MDLHRLKESDVETYFKDLNNCTDISGKLLSEMKEIKPSSSNADVKVAQMEIIEQLKKKPDGEIQKHSESHNEVVVNEGVNLNGSSRTNNIIKDSKKLHTNNIEENLQTNITELSVDPNESLMDVADCNTPLDEEKPDSEIEKTINSEDKMQIDEDNRTINAEDKMLIDEGNTNASNKTSNQNSESDVNNPNKLPLINRNLDKMECDTSPEEKSNNQHEKRESLNSVSKVHSKIITPVVENKQISTECKALVSIHNELPTSKSICVDEEQGVSTNDKNPTYQNSDLPKQLLPSNQEMNSEKADLQNLEMGDEEICFKKFNQQFSCISINSQVAIFPNNSTPMSISFDSKGISLELPRFKKSSKTRMLSVSLSEPNVAHVLVYCDIYSFCFLSFITSTNLGEALKEDLRIYLRGSPYFNENAETTKQLKISFLLQNVTEDINTFLCGVYGNKKVTKINYESGLKMITPTSPKKNFRSPLLKTSSTFIYPPVRGGIEVKRTDIETLEIRKYLNDTIIDFYLRYIYENLPPDMQKRTHIFTAIFYQRLVLNFNNPNRTVFKSTENWIKNVDIFSKDFIFIPISKNRHWFLVAICYLTEMLKEPEEIILDCDSSETKRNEPLKLVKPGLSDDTRKTRNRSDLAQGEKKVPCICFFDSSESGSRMKEEKRKIANTLKEFLVKVWKSRNPDKNCNWNRLLTLKASCPMQKNSYDCGIYLLQYVESFCQKPISLGDPLPDLRNWFMDDAVKHKRSEIKKLINKLKEEQKIASPVSPTESGSSVDIINLT